MTGIENQTNLLVDCTKILLLHEDLESINKQRDDCKDLLELFKENQITNESKYKIKIGNNILQCSKNHCFKYIEQCNSELIKQKKEKYEQIAYQLRLLKRKNENSEQFPSIIQSLFLKYEIQ